MILKIARVITANMSILHVAEKNSIAKQVANILSRSNKRNIPTISKYNPIFQFQLEQKPHRFTSVRGHIFEYELPQQCKNWKAFDNKKILLCQVPMVKKFGKDMDDVVRNLQKLAKQHNQLILWLDCDREGEAIAYQVIEICLRMNPRIKIKRARFSAVTATDVWNAYQNLVDPNKLQADAVNYRIQIDFRTGCAFTRYQTTVFQSNFQLQSGSFISYGPCQMPTLSFVVQRYLQIKNFKPQKFWFIELIYVINQNTGIPFTWEKKNTRSQVQANQTLVCIISTFPDGNVMAKVKQRNKNQKKKYRPYPLTTVKFQKLATDKLRISSARAMQIAEKLYQKGLISYPRTETNAFPKTMNLKGLVQRLEGSPEFGDYVNKLLQQNKFLSPKAGSSNDEAHTPIHPVKMIQKSKLENQEWRVYDLIVRSFLASCSADAVGEEFQVKAQINGQKFKASYLTIKQLNYLQIYPFQKWVQTSFPSQIPDNFPVQVTLKDSKTTPPGYLTQSELIDMMQKNQIGTDSTIHQHIQTIQKRQYAIKTNNTFKPTNLGASIVQTYKQLQIALPQCQIRRKIEEKMNRIASGQIQKQAATQQTLHQMIPIYEKLTTIKTQWLNTIKKFMESNSDLKQIQVQQKVQGLQQNDNKRNSINVFQCPKCNEQNAVVRFSQKRGSYFLGCSGFPNCKWTHSIPSMIQQIKPTSQKCQKCEANLVQIKASPSKMIGTMIKIRYLQCESGYLKICLKPGCDSDLFEQYDYNNSNPNTNTNANANTNTNYVNTNTYNNFNRNKRNMSEDPEDSSNNQSSRYKNFSRSNSNFKKNINQDNNFKSNTTGWTKNNQEKRQIRCYKCGQPGHISPNCPQSQGAGGTVRKYEQFKTGFPQQRKKKSNMSSQSGQSQEEKVKKICPQCGTEGRHPRGSQCPSVVRKRKQKQ